MKHENEAQAIANKDASQALWWIRSHCINWAGHCLYCVCVQHCSAYLGLSCVLNYLCRHAGTNKGSGSCEAKTWATLTVWPGRSRNGPTAYYRANEGKWKQVSRWMSESGDWDRWSNLRASGGQVESCTELAWEYVSGRRDSKVLISLLACKHTRQGWQK